MFRHMFKWSKPKNVDRAATIRLRLSMAYAFLGWNAFILMFYRMMNDDLPSDPVERRSTIVSKLSPVNNVRVMRFDGFELVEDKEVQLANEKEKEEKEEKANS